MPDDAARADDSRYWLRHPRQWLREPAFWREVTARTLATVAAAAVIYMAALLLGYVQRPTGQRLLVLTVSVGLYLLVLRVVLALVSGNAWLRRQRRGVWQALRLLTFAAVVLLFTLTLVPVLDRLAPR